MQVLTMHELRQLNWYIMPVLCTSKVCNAGIIMLAGTGTVIILLTATTCQNYSSVIRFGRVNLVTLIVAILLACILMLLQ